MTQQISNSPHTDSVRRHLDELLRSISLLNPAERLLTLCLFSVAILCFFPWTNVKMYPGDLASLFGTVRSHTFVSGLRSQQGSLVFLLSLGTIIYLLLEKTKKIGLGEKYATLIPLVTTAAASVLMLLYFVQISAGGVFGFAVSKTLWFYITAAILGLATWRSYEQARKGGFLKLPPPPPSPAN